MKGKLAITVCWVGKSQDGKEYTKNEKYFWYFLKPRAPKKSSEKNEKAEKARHFASD